jgi:hypothetical protein
MGGSGDSRILGGKRRCRVSGQNVYVYRAALYCEECGDAIKVRLTDQAPEDASDESSYDSDDYPKGPFDDGGGEADTPHHCDACGVFLENPLTGDGVEYVRETIERETIAGEVGKVALEWSAFYGIEPEAPPA